MQLACKTPNNNILIMAFMHNKISSQTNYKHRDLLQQILLQLFHRCSNAISICTVIAKLQLCNYKRIKLLLVLEFQSKNVLPTRHIYLHSYFKLIEVKCKKIIFVWFPKQMNSRLPFKEKNLLCLQYDIKTCVFAHNLYTRWWCTWFADLII